MKFFNLDLHVSVIEDVATQLRDLGHTVDSHLMSGHWWALGKKPAAAGTGEHHVGYGAVNVLSWESLFNDFPELEKVKAWQLAHPELNEYDGFIATYPPAFALLYEAFRGHTIIDIPIRYDLHFTHRPEAWQEFNRRLAEGVETGRMTTVANSLYDALYFEHFTGQWCEYISSTCDYVDKLAPKWSPRTKKMLAFGEHSGGREAAKHVEDLHFVRDVLPQYKHADIARAYGIVWVPYNCSIMSFFEHYWLGIPLFVPTQGFLLDLHKQGLALSQLTWHENLTGGSKIPAKRKMHDPHTELGVQSWMTTYDFYNGMEFPHITYFSSWNDLKEKIAGTDFATVSQAMLAHNQVRKERNLRKWAKILERVT